MKLYINKGSLLVCLNDYYDRKKTYATEHNLVMTPIYYGYLDRNLYNSIDESLMDMLKEQQYFIIFIKRQYWLVSKYDCMIEKY